MSTIYIPNRHHKEISRSELIAFAQDYSLGLIVADKAASAGRTINDAESIGIADGPDYAWFSFGESDTVVLASVYGLNHGRAIDSVTSHFGVEFISEHDDDFQYHAFPVDIKTATPDYEWDGWKGYLIEGWCLVQHEVHGIFDHLARQVTDNFDFETYVKEVVLPNVL